ncbi:MAG: response regulator transcription factor [Bacteroidetes bacterium]|nr:response regulator transcription factor [Bacteroidota bacterium]
MIALKKRVVIIEEDSSLLQILSLVIGGTEKFNVIGLYGTFDEAFKSFKKSIPDIVLMDIDLPGTNGIEGTRLLREYYPATEVVIVTNYENDEIIFEALRAGAIGYILKSINYVELILALEELIKGGAPLSSKIARKVINNYHVNLNSPLSSRERQIMQMISVGKTYSEIAEECHISKETSKTHIRNIYMKLKVNSKSEAIAKANNDRLI